MGEWNLTGELREIITPIIHNFIEYGETSIDLSSTGVNPIQLGDFLEELGYESSGIDTNGWQCDYCIYYYHPDKKELCISGTAICHSIKLSFVEE